MPLVPIMVVPYASLIPLALLSGFFFASTGLKAVQAYALALLLAFLLSYGFYATMQSYVARPTLVGGDTLRQWVRLVYSLDKPYNDFPSLHTSISAIIAERWVHAHRRSGYLVTAWCVLIIASTVLIHQHYIADIAGGLFTAMLAINGADYMVGRVNRAKLSKG